MKFFGLLLIGAFLLGMPDANTTAQAAGNDMKKSMTKGAMSK